MNAGPVPVIPAIKISGDIAVAMERMDVASQELGAMLARADIADRLRLPLLGVQHALAGWPGHSVPHAVAKLVTAVEAVVRSGS